MYTEMRNLIKEHIKKAEDRVDVLAHLNALIYSVTYDIREEEKEAKENASQSQAG